MKLFTLVSLLLSVFLAVSEPVYASSAASRYKTGLKCARKGDYKKAIKIWKSILADNPGKKVQARLCLKIAKLYFKMRKLEPARRYAEKADSILPGSKSVASLLNLIDYREGQAQREKTAATGEKDNRFGFLRLDVHPAGARVFIESEKIDPRSWDKVRLPVGEHTVSIRLDGYEEKDFTVDIPLEESITLSCTLERKKIKPGKAFQAGIEYYKQKDYKAAVEAFRIAADGNIIEAQNALADCLIRGMGCRKDAKEAVRWYTKAAEKGNAYAQLNLAFCYLRGTGTSKIPEIATQWLRKSAEQGNASAQVNLGVCYERAYGVKEDLKQAVSWYTKAAGQGNARAQYNLGVSYENGIGVKKDLAKAIEWYRKAAAQGLKEAEEKVDRLDADGKKRDKSPNDKKEDQ